MSVTISYDGDTSNLTLRRAARVEILKHSDRAHVYGFHWDENESRLTFDPDGATDMVLELRPGARIPRLGRHYVRPA